MEEAMSQADDEGTPPKFNIHTLNQLAVRLVDHAESIENITAHEMECDLRLAAAACERLAHLRFEVAEIAAGCKDKDAEAALLKALQESEA